ncbi:MAG: FG-GAP-like repeat-containing protein [bacterium]
MKTMNLSKILMLAVTLLALVERSSSQDFIAITTGALVDDAGAARGVSWIDFNNDGFLDLFVTRGPRQGQTALLFRNDGGPNFAFTKITGSPLVNDVARSDGSSWGDYDNDGDPDAYVVTWYGDRNLFYENNGNGTFTKITTSASAWGDYDNDGHLDLYVTNSGDPNATGPQRNFLYRNNGNKSFAKIASGAPPTDLFYSRGVNWIDYDDDGDLDLFVANEENQNNNLYQNLLKESSSATFQKVTMGAPVTDGGSSWTASWGDYDNDGDLDLYVTQAYGQGSLKNFLYRNLLMESDTPAFEKMATGPAVNDLGHSYGFSWADFDQDGDLDLFVARTLNENQKNAFYINNLSGESWLQVRAVGVQSNKSAIGAKIRLKANVGGKAVWQRRDIAGQEGYCGQNLLAHFGLGEATAIDTVLVQWPSGIVDVLAPVNVNQILTITESMHPTEVEQKETALPSEYRLQQNYPNPFWSAATFRFAENPSTRIEYVLPRASHVRLTIYNAAGQEIRTLFDQMQPTGAHEKLWDGKNNANERVPSGVYFYRIVAGPFRQTRKMLLLQ